MKQIIVNNGEQTERTMTPEEEAAFEASRPVPLTEDQIIDLQLAYMRRVDIKLFRAMFFLVNEVRALQSKAPITVDQFKTWLKGL